MTRLAAVLLTVCLLSPGCGTSAGDARARGGWLAFGIRQDPQTYNPLLAVDRVSLLLASQLHAPLLRINRTTDALEPELAESWSFSDDGATLTFKLRKDVRFSDGAPFSAEDVVFSLGVLHDPRVESPLSESARIDGRPLVAEVVDRRTVRIRLPRRIAAIERFFDSLYILPRHRLARALEEGTFASTYGMGASEVVGLGPFVLDAFSPGRSVLLKPNPHYWKPGLPRLDGIRFAIVPDANALLLRFKTGELDVLERVAPDDFFALQEARLPNLHLMDLGEGLSPERLWFNLNPKASAVSAEKRAWFSNDNVRRALSLAIDRRAIADVVYRGLASPAAGPVSGANRLWRNEDLEPRAQDGARARELLDAAALAPGRLAFTLLTNSENPLRVKVAALIQQDLARVGVEMNVATPGAAELGKRIRSSFDYEACLFGLAATDTDPSTEIPLWQSSSPLHVWAPSQSAPATFWEARIDALMEQQRLALDPRLRKKLFDEVQALAFEYEPVLDLVVPHALIGVNARVIGLKPSPLWHPLWNSEEIHILSR